MVRFFLDKNVNNIPIPNCNEKSLAERMNEKEKLLHSSKLDIDLRTDNYFDFQTVYSMENETINEISNATEHAYYHQSVVRFDFDISSLQMTFPNNLQLGVLTAIILDREGQILSMVHLLICI